MQSPFLLPKKKSKGEPEPKNKQTGRSQINPGKRIGRPRGKDLEEGGCAWCMVQFARILHSDFAFCNFAPSALCRSQVAVCVLHFVWALPLLPSVQQHSAAVPGWELPSDVGVGGRVGRWAGGGHAFTYLKYVLYMYRPSRIESISMRHILHEIRGDEDGDERHL